MSIFNEIAGMHKGLKKKLLMAKIKKTPEEYVKEAFRGALTATFMVIVGAFLLFEGIKINKIFLIFVFLISFLVLFNLFMKRVDVVIRKRAREIDKEVLFAGRFLLVKLHSGKPLINSLIDASKSYGVANKYFKEIITDIELGTPVEEALEKGSRYTPSENFKKILFQLTTALKIGVDVTKFLEATLDEIAEEQLLNIKKYGKKLSGLTMFYMLFAIVIPSLGITLFITIASLVNIKVDIVLFGFFLFLLLIIEFLFITIFKGARPNINI